MSGNKKKWVLNQIDNYSINILTFLRKQAKFSIMQLDFVISILQFESLTDQFYEAN